MLSQCLLCLNCPMGGRIDIMSKYARFSEDILDVLGDIRGHSSNQFLEGVEGDRTSPKIPYIGSFSVRISVRVLEFDLRS